MAGRSRAGDGLQRHSGTIDRLHCAKPCLLRLHIAGPPAPKYARVSAGPCTSSLGQMVSAISRGKLDDGMAAAFLDDVAPEPRTRSNLCPSGSAPDELLCYRTMDAIASTLRSHPK